MCVVARRRYRGRVASFDDVVAIVSTLPNVTEGVSYRNRTWNVGKKFFAWERPFSKADIRRFGDQPVPQGPILAVKVDDLMEKAAVLSANPKAFFTIAHFDNFPAVLIQLDKVTKKALREALIDAWLSQAPAVFADAYVADRRRA